MATTIDINSLDDFLATFNATISPDKEGMIININCDIDLNDKTIETSLASPSTSGLTNLITVNGNNHKISNLTDVWRFTYNYNTMTVIFKDLTLSVFSNASKQAYVNGKSDTLTIFDNCNIQLYNYCQKSIFYNVTASNSIITYNGGYMGYEGVTYNTCYIKYDHTTITYKSTGYIKCTNCYITGLVTYDTNPYIRGECTNCIITLQVNSDSLTQLPLVYNKQSAMYINLYDKTLYPTSASDREDFVGLSTEDLKSYDKVAATGFPIIKVD